MRKFKFGFNIIQIWVEIHHLHIYEDMKGKNSAWSIFNMTTPLTGVLRVFKLLIFYLF